LEALAVSILAAGFPVIVDATFLKRSLRERFLAIATARGAPGLILSLQVDPQILRARLAQRHADVSDANVAILEAQLARQESLTPVERQQTLSVDAGRAFDVPGLLRRLRDRVSD
jgi:predicted kinase